MDPATQQDRLITLYDSTSGGETLCLLLPGLSGNAAAWEPVISHLQGEVAVAVGAPILPVKGLSWPAPSVAEVAGRMVGELQSMSYKRVLVVAHSVGAFVALSMALALPRVVGVVLINGGLTDVAKFLDRPLRQGLAEPRTSLQAIKLFALVGSPAPARFKRMIAGSERASRAMLGQLVSPESLKDPDRRRSLIERAGHAGVLAALWVNRHHWRAFQRYAGKVSARVVFVVGARDPVASVQSARHMAAYLPNSDIALLEGIGHAAMIEDADRVAAFIRSELARIDDA